MLLTVAVIVMAVPAPLMTKCAVPKELGRRAPPVVVGFVGGTSCEFVRFTVKSFGDRFAVVSRASTNWSFVKVDGYFATNSGRFTKSLKNATLFASSTASAPGWPKTNPRSSACRSRMKLPYRTGAGEPDAFGPKRSEERRVGKECRSLW